MKSFSIVLVIILSLVSLSFVTWLGRPTKVAPLTARPPIVTVEDLPMKKSGPFGKVEVQETEFNFGTRNVGDKGTHIFKIKNVGEGVLTFKMGSPTCQCTVGKITRDNDEEIKEGPIAPGESINIQLNWKMEVPRDSFRHGVPVFTDDPDYRKVDFAVAGIVTPLYEFKPEGYWNVGDITGSDPAKAEGYFVSKALEEFSIEETPRENTKLKITLEPLQTDMVSSHEIRSGYRVHVEVNPDIPVGRFREAFQLTAQSPQGNKTVDVTVIANRPGPLDIKGAVGAGYNPESDRVIFKDFLASTGAKATVTLVAKGFEGDLEIQSVEPEDSRVKVKMLDSGTALGKSKSYKVGVEILPGSPINHRGFSAEPITIKLNHPEVTEFRLLIDYNATR